MRGISDKCGTRKNGEKDERVREAEEVPALLFTTDHSPFTSSPPLILKREMHQHIGQRVSMLGYMIHVKTTTTQAGNSMSFGSFIDPAGDFWDSTQFPQVAERYPFRGRGVYRFTGVVEEEFGHVSLRTSSMEKLPWRADPRYGEK